MTIFIFVGQRASKRFRCRFLPIPTAFGVPQPTPQEVLSTNPLARSHTCSAPSQINRLFIACRFPRVRSSSRTTLHMLPAAMTHVVEAPAPSILGACLACDVLILATCSSASRRKTRTLLRLQSVSFLALLVDVVLLNFCLWSSDLNHHC